MTDEGKTPPEQAGKPVEKSAEKSATVEQPKVPEQPKPAEQSKSAEQSKAPEKPNTSVLGDVMPPVMPQIQDAQRDAQTHTARLMAPWRLLMQIGGENQTTVGIEVKDRIVLGRGDPVANYYPDLDLSPYGGQEGGVSRRHAAIVQDTDSKALYLEDLGSTNGTRINGFSLEARRRYRLRDGDNLEFGRVTMVLRFVRSPHQ